ncbi:hemolysin family protein [Angustibacter sp. McL0619]|uniref:hemolysin family protein n=1 Tax=Angustibacter sp. McL0619 TaxID=3415676 RepID=UPI003CE6CCE5
MTEWLLLLASVVLTLGTAVFVAAEFSLVTLDRSFVERSVSEGDARSGPVLSALRQLSTQLSACQVGITLTTLLVGYLAEPSIAALLGGPLEAIGVPESAVQPVAVTAALVLATGFSMVIGELVPKNLAIARPLGTAQLIAVPMRMFSLVAKPLIVLLNGSANALLRRVGVEPKEELSSARTPQELASLVRRSAEAGTLGASTARLLTRSLGFGERTAEDVMTPRLRCTVVQREESAADVVRLARSTGHSRFPVVDEGLDDVVGVVHVKRAVSVPLDRRGEVPAAALMSEPLMVPETVRLDPLLAQLREQGLQLAVVVDEYGGTSGVVTLEDVIEEIVGEVADEHDRGRTVGRRLRDGAWVVPGLWRPDELRDRVGAPVPDDGAYETVGGFVMARLGRVPDVGDVVSIAGWRLSVTRMDGRRVDRLLVTPVPEEQPSDEDGER